MKTAKGDLQPAPRVKDKFFPERGDTASEAQLICLGCTVRRQCGDYSQRIDADYGVWAGAIKKRGKDEAEDT